MVEQTSLEVISKRKEREEYYVRKEKLVKLETDNLSKIIFMKGTGGFWIVGGHSAVILANKVGKALKMRVPLKKDTDYDLRFPEGKVSVKNLGYYRRQLEGSGMVELETKNEEFCVFKLKKKLSKTEYELLAEMKELRRRQLEEAVIRNIPMPATHTNINEVMRVAFKIYSKYTDKDAKDVFGNRLMDELRTVQKMFLMICMEEMPFDSGVQRMQKMLTRAQAGVLQMVENGIWNVEDAGALQVAVAETKLSLAREIKMVQKLKEKAGVAGDVDAGQ